MTRRFGRCIALGLAVVMVAMSTAGSAGAKAIRPTHYISCGLTAVAPQQWYRGTVVTSSGRIQCTSPPDIVQVSVIIWRYDGGGKYTKIAHKTSSQSGTDWWVMVQAGCTYSRAFPMHTQVLFSGFHGNWWDEKVNSHTVTMYC